VARELVKSFSKKQFGEKLLDRQKNSAKTKTLATLWWEIQDWHVKGPAEWSSGGCFQRKEDKTRRTQWE